MRIEATAAGEERQIIDCQEWPALCPVIFCEDELLLLKDVGHVHVSIFLDDDIVSHFLIRGVVQENFHACHGGELLLLDVLLPLRRQCGVVIQGHLGVHVPTGRVHLHFRAREIVEFDRALIRLAGRDVKRDLQPVAVLQQNVERRKFFLVATLGVHGINAHGVEETTPGGVLVQTVEHSHLESEGSLVRASDVDLMQAPFPHVSPHFGELFVVVGIANDTIPRKPVWELQSLGGLGTLLLELTAFNDTHGFPVDTIACVPRGARYFLEVFFVAHHVIDTVVHKNCNLILLAVADEIIDETEV